MQVQRTRGRSQGQFPMRRMGGGGGKLNGWEEGEEDSGEFGNGSGWPEREEVRGGSDGEKTGEIVEGMIGGDGGAAFWRRRRRWRRLEAAATAAAAAGRQHVDN